ncbi:hypothetical protein NLX86_31500 [Streptomyces sp. A3M-1-3]|uniref:hypothetical protein n=1 Tax=Streptomyces sp. A3M-1-3 TaxID=2962044 RepID=UPI0020B7F98B|nr:hypothetical protein [Streptomyces sp. A3M-1-3]MCP3822450.1 hypothetical protein [Streptomyces sp. A3M-1-3]
MVQQIVNLLQGSNLANVEIIEVPVAELNQQTARVLRRVYEDGATVVVVAGRYRQPLATIRPYMERDDSSPSEEGDGA